MHQTVAECLTAATDSATVINDVNTNGKRSTHIGGTADTDTDMSQADINILIQQNVDHLEVILAYDGTGLTPNVVGSSSSKKTTCSDAITTGKAYIAAN
tara:strand:+ start:266 stop:562 length:297 start_codon:yes stop_codon:yes gene_type:complete